MLRASARCDAAAEAGVLLRELWVTSAVPPWGLWLLAAAAQLRLSLSGQAPLGASCRVLCSPASIQGEQSLPVLLPFVPCMQVKDLHRYPDCPGDGALRKRGCRGMAH